ncbi:MAG: hypothetical protein AB7I04_22295 [Pseudomonadales bacterium]
MKKLVAEPLTWFLLFGMLLFAAGEIARTAQKPEILLDSAAVEALITRRQAQEMRVLDPAERQAAIDEWVADEILFREAYRRGLYEDERIRRALILKMRSQITGELTPPSEAVLREWFDGHRERYRRADGELADFDAARPYLQGDWMMEQSRQAVRAEVARLRDGYEIVIEAG